MPPVHPQKDAQDPGGTQDRRSVDGNREKGCQEEAFGEGTVR